MFLKTCKYTFKNRYIIYLAGFSKGDCQREARRRYDGELRPPRPRSNQGGRKDGRGNEPLPLRNVRCAEPPEDSLTLQCRLFMDEELDELGSV